MFFNKRGLGTIYFLNGVKLTNIYICAVLTAVVCPKRSWELEGVPSNRKQKKNQKIQYS